MLLINIKLYSIKNLIALFLKLLKEQVAWYLEEVTGSQLLLREERFLEGSLSNNYDMVANISYLKNSTFFPTTNSLFSYMLIKARKLFSYNGQLELPRRQPQEDKNRHLKK